MRGSQNAPLFGVGNMYSSVECAFNICHWTSQSQSRNPLINMKYAMELSIKQASNISFMQSANVPSQSIN